MNTKKKILLTLLGIIAISVPLTIYFSMNANGNGNTNTNDNNQVEEEPEPEPQVQILDLDDKTRPIAVMIDNNVRARPHSGLQDAYLIYEMIVEGGQTRLMALFHNKDTEIVGPVRSSRHYFLDYVLENDAIYAHFGGSPKAYDDLRRLNIASIDGMTVSGAYYRDSSRRAPHNAYTTMERLNNRIDSVNFREKMSEGHVFEYSVEEVDLASREESVESLAPKFQYSSSHRSTYTYDEENKVYIRSMNGNLHMDRETNNAYTFKNIVAIYVQNVALDNQGRQDLRNITTGEGYYISNGHAVPINYSKSSRSAQTKFTFKDGTPLVINDGNTMVQIFPTGRTIALN